MTDVAWRKPQGLVWEDPRRERTTRARRHGSKYVEEEAALRSRPGQWGRIDTTGLTQHAVRNLAHRINYGLMVAFAVGDWEAVTRVENDEMVVYVRFLGGTNTRPRLPKTHDIGDWQILPDGRAISPAGHRYRADSVMATRMRAKASAAHA